MAVPRPCPAHLEFDLLDETATVTLAQRLAPLARAGDVLALYGELGTGKTVFARAFINALPGPDGSFAAEEVPSPTFTLVQVYERAPAPVWHFDLFRLEHPEEVYELGLEEALGGAISLIEWPERLGALLPPERLDVRFAYATEAGARCATLSGGEAWSGRLAALARA